MEVTSSSGNIARIKVNGLFNRYFQNMRKISRIISGSKSSNIKTIMMYPPISNEDILGDIINRLCWFLPEEKDSELQVFIPLFDSLSHSRIEVTELSQPPAQARYIQNRRSFSFVSKAEARYKLGVVDLILLWDASHLKNPFLLKHLHKTEIVDPNFYASIEGVTYAGLYHKTLSTTQRKYYRSLSKRNYRILLNSVGSCKDAYLFATGPSLDRALNFSFDDNSFKVICNTIVKNKKLLNHIRPQLLTLSDPFFFFGPSRYSADFRKDMLSVVCDYDCYCITHEKYVPLLLVHYPDLESKIIGIPKSEKKKIDFPTIDNFYIPATANILTGFMLPVASVIAQNIYIIGADGGEQTKGHFWKYWNYSSAAQFDDLAQTVAATHPSQLQFRDVIYEKYYKKHCEMLASLIEYGESLGKSYYSLTPSFIPALKQRYMLIHSKTNKVIE